jgi:5-methyltetrahydropteroyltriglutamate--homocysteine methyltransferase
LAFHICFGNRFGRARFKRRYGDYFPGVLEARTDQFVLEFASRELAEIERWKEWDDGRELGAGVIDVKSFYPESPEDVAGRIRRVLHYVKPDKLYLNPDCGFGWSPREMCVQKLQAMVAGAKIVREELSKG